jgi:hypothetical protein
MFATYQGRESPKTVRVDLAASLKIVRVDLAASLKTVRVDLAASPKTVRVDLAASLKTVRVDLAARHLRLAGVKHVCNMSGWIVSIDTRKSV